MQEHIDTLEYIYNGIGTAITAYEAAEKTEEYDPGFNLYLDIELIQETVLGMIKELKYIRSNLDESN